MGIKDTLTLLKWFQILPNEIDSNTLLFGTSENPIISNKEDINSYMPWASEIETKLGYKFKNRGYLLQVISNFILIFNNKEKIILKIIYF